MISPIRWNLSSITTFKTEGCRLIKVGSLFYRSQLPTRAYPQGTGRQADNINANRRHKPLLSYGVDFGRINMQEPSDGSCIFMHPNRAVIIAICTLNRKLGEHQLWLSINILICLFLKNRRPGRHCAAYDSAAPAIGPFPIPAIHPNTF